jgi:hypothetical protein
MTDVLLFIQQVHLTIADHKQLIAPDRQGGWNIKHRVVQINCPVFWHKSARRPENENSPASLAIALARTTLLSKYEKGIEEASPGAFGNRRTRLTPNSF